MEIVLQHHLQKIIQIKEKPTPTKGQSVESSLSQWFSNPNVLAEVDLIVTKMMKVSKAVTKIEIPSFSLGILGLNSSPKVGSVKRVGKKAKH